MKNKNILKWIVPVVCMIGLSSCLKNKNEQPDFSSATPILEFPVNAPTGDGSPNSLSVALVLDEAPFTFNYYINYAAAKANATDLKINLALDTSLISKYNAAHPDAQIDTTLSTDAYTMPLTVTIPAGARKMSIPIVFKSTLIDPSMSFGIPITVSDAAGVTLSKNFGSLIIKVGVKNIYDGIYTIKGFVDRLPNAPDDALRGYLKAGLTTEVVTLNATSNAFSQWWANGGGVGGIAGLKFTVNPETNKVSVSSDNATMRNTPGYDNRYDPATKTFYLAFDWGSPTNRIAVDTLIYKGSR